MTKVGQSDRFLRNLTPDWCILATRGGWTVNDDRYEEYRLRAAYCREMAKAASNVEMQGRWDYLGHTWLAMIPKDAQLDPGGFYDRPVPAELPARQRAA